MLTKHRFLTVIPQLELFTNRLNFSKMDCNYCKRYLKFLLPMVVLFLSFGTLQAQTTQKCDLSKCAPEERAACAKKCARTSDFSMTSLVSLLFESKAETSTQTNCQPAACQKKSAESAQLVSSTSNDAASYGNSLAEPVAASESAVPKKPCCKKGTTTCDKKMTSL
ncbi:MAG: hypothetical protein AAF960_30335 [Bacteroidota bacterium]